MYLSDASAMSAIIPRVIRMKLRLSIWDLLLVGAAVETLLVEFA